MPSTARIRQGAKLGIQREHSKARIRDWIAQAERLAGCGIRPAQSVDVAWKAAVNGISMQFYAFTEYSRLKPMVRWFAVRTDCSRGI
jgi:hypothetical protein